MGDSWPLFPNYDPNNIPTARGMQLFHSAVGAFTLRRWLAREAGAFRSKEAQAMALATRTYAARLRGSRAAEGTTDVRRHTASTLNRAIDSHPEWRKRRRNSSASRRRPSTENIA